MNTTRRLLEGERSTHLETVRMKYNDEVARPDRDVLPALAILWAVSALRAGGAIWLHQTFGAEATLALVALVAIPCLIARRRSRLDRSKLN